MGDFSVKAILSAVDKGYTSTMKSALSTANSLKSTLTSGLGFGMLMGAGQAAFSAITSSASELVKEIDSSNATWKTFTSNMEMVGKSKREIAGVKKELQNFAEQTIYSSSDMASTFAQLEAVGTKNTKKLVKGFGGLAAAAENPQQAMKTLSTQATQMAAKPTVAWMDFKLMLEQTPSGIAAVAKQMGKTTSQLVSEVQAGTVATEDFFDAISAVGTNEAFTKLATTYKTAGQAMDGLQETVANKLAPAFDALSGVAISSISGIINKVSSLDGDAIRAAFSIDNLKSAAMDLGVVAGAVAGLAGAIPIMDVVERGFSKVADKGELITGALIKAQDKTALLGKAIAGSIKPGTKAFENLSGESKLFAERLTGIKQILNGSFDPDSEGFSKFNKSSKEYLLNLNDMKGKSVGVGSSIKSMSKSVSSMIPDNLKKKATDLGDIISGTFIQSKGSIQKIGDAIGLVSFKFGTATGRFEKDAPVVWKAFDGIKNKAEKVVLAFKKVGTGIGSGIQKAAGVGMKTMNGMVSSLTSVMRVAMSALGPAAILGVALAGMGILNSRFGGEIDSLIQTVMVKGPQIIDGLVKSITGKLPVLIKAGAQMVSGFLDAITTNLPSVINGGVQIITALVQGVGANVGTMLPSAINLVTTFVSGILSALPQLLLAGMQFLQSLSEGILSNIGLIVQSASGIIQSFVGSVMSNLPGIINAGLQILTNLAQGAIQALPQLLVVGLNAITMLITGIAGQLPNIMQTGVQLIQMLIQGVVQNLPNILTAAVQAITAFIQGIVQNLPSIISSGIQIIGSLIGGLIQMLPSIVSAGWELIKSLGAGIVEAIPNIITGAVEGIKGIFSDLWGFITGKNKEGSAQTAVDMAAMTQSVNTSVSEMGSNVSASFATMNGTAISETSSLMSSVTSNLSGMNSLGSADMSGLANSIIGSAGDANASASGAIADMARNVNSSMSNIESSAAKGMNKLPVIAKTSMDQFSRSMKSGFNQAVSVTRSSITSIVSAMRSGYGGAYSSGAYIGQGLANGMRSMLGTVRSVAAQLASAANEAIAAKAKIGSPSKITTQFGEWYGEGWVNGIHSMIKASKRAVVDLFSVPQPSDIRIPSLALAGGGSMELNDDYEYGESNPTYTIYVVSELDGRQVAKSTVVYTKKELEELERRNNRKKGYR